nr:unnamed protein product [Callosobruchus chinensis]CAH7712341.1 unnamed protein product [Callosobruchus chinensis]CAH7712392.1 unnamed protein product [Callosobruchus chinensis]CAH7713368.1 unnamed protein product [Callosobruchus chinensis]CAH7713922.1 unnamed protein product [Callosobruchus chinensis]
MQSREGQFDSSVTRP